MENFGLPLAGIREIIRAVVIGFFLNNQRMKEVLGRVKKDVFILWVL